jgi:hypothetical protein
MPRQHISSRSPARQRHIPCSSRGRSPDTPARARQSPQESSGKACSWRKSPPIPAQPASAKTGLSRRRSRVRVSSLSRISRTKTLQIKHCVACPGTNDRRLPFDPAHIPHGNPGREPPVAGDSCRTPGQGDRRSIMVSRKAPAHGRPRLDSERRRADCRGLRLIPPRAGISTRDG